MIDLHRHTEHSTFDGFGKTAEAAAHAKLLGYTSLGISDHGNVSGLVSHYFDCKEAGIKPIMGCEVYFMPKFKKTRQSYHLCLFVKNLVGYHNLNKLLTQANLERYYYKGIVDFSMLQNNREGLICTSACIGGPLSYLVINNKMDIAEKIALKFKELFKGDFYIELQPYALTEAGLQEKCNLLLMKLAKKLKIKCILTSDSHYIDSEDFDTYLKMHEIAGHKDFGAQYSERYMPTEKELIKRFGKMHINDFKSKEAVIKYAKQCITNLDEIEGKVDDVILEKLELCLPKYESKLSSSKQLEINVKNGLKQIGKYNKKYWTRCKQELEVINYHGFEDYFLMVQDYVQYAKSVGIEVGPGRGSVCNCLVAFALGITDVDSIVFDLDFRRFLRKDKKKLPDVDIDFETDRRGEVIDYLLHKYEGKAAHICSYGLYKLDNLLNDLFKICGLAMSSKHDDDKDKNVKDIRTKEIQLAIKQNIRKYINADTFNLDYEVMRHDTDLKFYDNRYDNIIKHFIKLFKKVRFYGTHAAGVAITGDELSKYTAIIRRAKEMYTTAYDLVNCEEINLVKFDMLGLRTMSILRELRDLTGNEHRFNYDLLYDRKLYEQFALGNTDGIFQYETKGAKAILKRINADCYQDVIAANALNRPGPLSLNMDVTYAKEKGLAVQEEELELTGDEEIDKEKLEKERTKNLFYKYAGETYGTFVYQEQIMRVCVELGNMTWGEADKVMKLLKTGGTGTTEKYANIIIKEEQELTDKFVKGAVSQGINAKDAHDVFQRLLVYSFNKGHAVGYALIGIEQMYYKVYHNTVFWYVTLKYANDKDIRRLSGKAIRDGSIILLPHINGCSKYCMKKVDGVICIQEGMSKLKGVGTKAADIIEAERKENGSYTSYDDFIDRIAPYRRVVNKRVVDILKESGAIEFNNKVYYERVHKYNSTLYSQVI